MSILAQLFLFELNISLCMFQINCKAQICSYSYARATPPTPACLRYFSKGVSSLFAGDLATVEIGASARKGDATEIEPTLPILTEVS
jgi:hypothetical protein